MVSLLTNMDIILASSLGHSLTQWFRSEDISRILCGYLLGINPLIFNQEIYWSYQEAYWRHLNESVLQNEGCLKLFCWISPHLLFFSVSYSSIQFLFYHWYYQCGLLLFMLRNVTCKCKRESWDMMSSRTWTVIEGQIWEDVRGEVPKTGNYLRRRDQSWRQGSSYHPLTPGYRHQKLKSDE